VEKFGSSRKNETDRSREHVFRGKRENRAVVSRDLVLVAILLSVVAAPVIAGLEQ